MNLDPISKNHSYHNYNIGDNYDIGEFLRSKSNHLFWIFIFLHGLIWTVIPTHFHPAFPMDVIEGLSWAQDLALGYKKHPPLTAWVLAAWKTFFGNDVWFYYLLAQLFVISGLWAVWTLAKEMLSPPRALIATMLLESIFYYNFESTDFNPNTAQLALWPLLMLVFYRAIKQNSTWYWGLVGLFSALTMLTKYSGVILFLPMFLYLVFDTEARKCWRTSGPYISATVMLLLLAPHIWWLFATDFPTIKYALMRTSAKASGLKHLLYPLRFLIGQILALLPVIILAAILVSQKPFRLTPNRHLTFDRRFILAMLFGPALTYMAISAIMGFKIRTMWATPLWPMAGVGFLLFLQSKLSLQRLNWFVRAWMAVFIITILAYSTMLSVGPFVSMVPSKGHFSADLLAQQITGRWRKKYHSPLPYVIGRTWLAGSAALHSSDHPKVLIFDRGYSKTDANIDNIHRYGGVILWDAHVYGTSTPGHLLTFLPSAETQPPMEIPWKRPFPVSSNIWKWSTLLPPKRIGWAIIPPKL